MIKIQPTTNDANFITGYYVIDTVKTISTTYTQDVINKPSIITRVKRNYEFSHILENKNTRLVTIVFHRVSQKKLHVETYAEAKAIKNNWNKGN